MQNNMFKNTGIKRLSNITLIVLMLFLSVLYGLAISKMGLTIGVVLMILPAIGYVGYLFFLNPILSLKAAMVYPFVFGAVTKYLVYLLHGTSPPIGLLFLFLVFYSLVSYFFVEWKNIKWEMGFNSFTILQLIWLVYGILQYFNPEAASKGAWFYGIRGFLSDFVFLVVGMMLLSEIKHVYFFIKLWFVLSIISSFHCVKQQFIGVDAAEQYWLNTGAYVTHLLFGKLRGFGSYSDAGQFGAAMGHVLTSSAIMALQKDLPQRKKLMYYAVAAISLFGMMLSGTRGALFVPVSGTFLFLLLNKNIKLIVLSAFVLGGVFYFLKFTKIAHGNYHVRRMRTALDPDDPSFQVRIQNQKRLKVYMSTRPFGGGVGACGSLGSRFSKGTFLGDFPPDSHYVAIWANYGIVGLILHGGILLFYLARGALVYLKTKDPELKQLTLGLVCGMFGIYVASYGNEVLTGQPTFIIVFISWIVFYHTPRWDKERTEIKHLKELP